MTIRFAAALIGLAAVAGCTMETTVRSSSQHIMTPEEAAKRDHDRKAKAEMPPPAMPQPTTLEGEAERLRAEVERHPLDPKWHFLLGQVYEKQGRLELAELRYRRGAELIRETPETQYTGPHFFLGRALAKQEKWGPAAAELSKAIAVKPPDIEGYYLNPDYRESYYLLGAIAYRQHDMGASERNFRQFLKYGGETSRVVEFFPELVAE